MNIMPILQSIRQIINDIEYIPLTSYKLKKIQKKYNNGKSLKVIFIIQFPEMWNSEKSLYYYLKKNRHFQTMILTVPKKSTSKSSGEFAYDEAFDYFKAEGIEAFSLLQDGKFVSLNKYNPDFIFVQRPYDDMMPSCYSLRRISHSGLICYIPYSGRLTNGIHLSYELNPRLMNSLFAFFADCTDSYKYALNWIESRKYNGLKKVFNVGFPRFDLLSSVQKRANDLGYTFLWLPRWSLSEVNDATHFFDYIEVLLDYFESHTEYTLIIRPHPLMFSNFLEQGAMTVDQISALKQKISQMANVEFDSNKDYLITFNQCDFLISDVTSLLLEFFATGKPIIFCDSFEPSKLTSEAKEIVKTFYHISNSKELIETIELLATGKDENKEKRLSVLRNTLKVDGKAGQHIVETLINDLSI